MAEQEPPAPDGSKHDTTDYSASKAPENQAEKTQDQPEPDARMLPGGKMGTPANVGMSAMDREEVPSRAEKPEELDFVDTPSGEK